MQSQRSRNRCTSPRSPYTCKAQEVPTDVKSKKSQPDVETKKSLQVEKPQKGRDKDTGRINNNKDNEFQLVKKGLPPGMVSGMALLQQRQAHLQVLDGFLDYSQVTITTRKRRAHSQACHPCHLQAQVQLHCPWVTKLHR